MIPDDLLKLLTAAVDGELTPAEEQRVRRVLADSAEARGLHARLQADSRRLRNLPVAAPPADLRDRIMARLPILTPTPIPTPLITPIRVPASLPFRSKRSRPWVPLAVAASVLLAVSASSFLFFVRQDGPAHSRPAGPTAQAERPHPRGAHAEPSWVDILPRENAPLSSVPPAADPPSSVVAVAPAPPDQASRPDELPLPRAVQPQPRDVLGFPALPPIPPLDLVQVRLPFLAPVAELDRVDVRQKLTEELGRDPAFRIDLFVTDLPRGVDVFQAAAKASGVTVLTDAAVPDRVKRKQGTAYLVYAECLNATDLRDVLSGLTTEDAKSPHRVFDALHITPVQLTELGKELKDAVGIDPGFGKHPPRPHNSPGATNESKPLSAGTADQVAKTLTTPGGKPPDKAAIMVTFAPAQFRANAGMSNELRQFFEHRGERKPSTVPVMLVIRQTNGN